MLFGFGLESNLSHISSFGDGSNDNLTSTMLVIALNLLEDMKFVKNIWCYKLYSFFGIETPKLIYN